MISMNHRNEKNHGKQMCDKTFVDRIAKNNHISTGHMMKKKKIPCKLCDFSAINEDILKKHMRVAMGHKINVICRFYQRGSCRKGKFCRFQHPQEVSSTKNQSNKTEGNQISSGQSNVQCKYWERCMKFPSCGFSHYEVCKYQEKCFKKEFCHFVHLNPLFLEARQTRISHF